MARWTVVRSRLSIALDRSGQEIALLFAWPAGSGSIPTTFENLEAVLFGIALLAEVESVRLFIRRIGESVTFELKDPAGGNRIAVVKIEEYKRGLAILRRD